MKFRTLLAAATSFVLPVLAHAQPLVGPYVSLEGGTSLLNSTHFSDSYGASGRLHYRPSYAGIGSLGYGVGYGFRVQLDGDYIHNTVDKATFRRGTTERVTGREDKFGPMFNVLYDIPVNFPLTPYVGGGVGYQFINAKYSAGSGIGSAGFSGAKGSFAYDLIGGVSYPIGAVPGLSVTAEYRFMVLTRSYSYGLSTLGGRPRGNPTPGSIRFGDETSNSFFAGIRYTLFAPAVAAPAVAQAMTPAAAPAPAAAQTYLVFFDWNRFDLTPRATAIIAQAASSSKTTTTTSLNVSGYTDTSGTPTYNQGLSERRARAVANQLVSDGVAASEIEIHAYGETHLLVPTGPGVREPQNRRVEIVLQ